MKKFIISDTIFKKFPDTQVAVVLAYGVNNRAAGTDAFLQQESEYAKTLFSQIPLSHNEHIKAWKKAYKTFGAENYRSSVEALLHRVIKNQPIDSINPLVDIYNGISMKYVMPIGGEDLNRIVGDIHLTFATGAEQFIALGTDQNDSPKTDEVIYVDGENEVLCRRWNWRESEKTKLTSKTTDAILFIDALSPVNSIEIKEAACDLAKRVEQFCQGKTKMFLLNKNYTHILLE